MVFLAAPDHPEIVEVHVQDHEIAEQENERGNETSIDRDQRTVIEGGETDSSGTGRETNGKRPFKCTIFLKIKLSFTFQE